LFWIQHKQTQREKGCPHKYAKVDLKTKSDTAFSLQFIGPTIRTFLEHSVDLRCPATRQYGQDLAA